MFKGVGNKTEPTSTFKDLILGKDTGLSFSRPCVCSVCRLFCSQTETFSLEILFMHCDGTEIYIYLSVTSALDVKLQHMVFCTVKSETI
jgi:hypothetical protein